MRLRLGRFAWELYYTRSKAVLPKQEVRRRIALVCGHLGYVTGVLEYVMTDIIKLRCIAISGCMLIVGYQLTQPQVQWPSAFWNSGFALLNVYQLYYLCRWFPPMTEEEEKLYMELGGEEQLAQRTFQELLEVGSWRTVEAQECLTQEGRVAETPEVYLLASGSCDVKLGGLVMSRLSAGSVIGEVWALTRGDPTDIAPADRTASATVAAGGQGARCFCLPLAQLRALPKLHEALTTVFAKALADHVTTLRNDHKVLNYKAVLEVACNAGPDPPAAVLAALSSFRQKHGVSNDQHFRATQAVPRCTNSKLIRSC